MSERLKELYPTIDENRTPLPRKLSTRDKSIFINVSPPYCCEYNLVLEYNSSVFTAGSVRASDSIPAQCQFYYFEIKIVDKGDGGCIGIGLTPQSSNLRKMPGWEKNTIGYHGDDGYIYSGSSNAGNSKGSGPLFGTSDVIGCGINLKTKEVIFTKNGADIGLEYLMMPGISLFPTVGLHTSGERVWVNFGQKPFRFNPSQSKKLAAK